jgi:hypothetical protein
MNAPELVYLVEHGEKAVAAAGSNAYAVSVGRPHGAGRRARAQAQRDRSVRPPSDDSGSHNAYTAMDAVRYGQLFNDVVTAAFICGTSRIGVLG